MAKFVAIKPAFYDGRRVRVGQEVSAPEGFKASWAVPKGGYKPEPAAAPAEPTALSQLEKGETFTQVHGKGKKAPPTDLA